MKIKIIRNEPAEGQGAITHILGQVFEIIPYSHYDKETRQEMKKFGEVGIEVENEGIYIINKNEYEIVEE